MGRSAGLDIDNCVTALTHALQEIAAKKILYNEDKERCLELMLSEDPGDRGKAYAILSNLIRDDRTLVLTEFAGEAAQMGRDPWACVIPQVPLGSKIVASNVLTTCTDHGNQIWGSVQKASRDM